MFVKFIFKPTSSPSSVSFYRVNTTNGNTCILIRTDGLLSIQYRDKLNEDKEADVYLPDNPTLSGMCLVKSLLLCFDSFQNLEKSSFISENLKLNLLNFYESFFISF